MLYNSLHIHPDAHYLMAMYPKYTVKSSHQLNCEPLGIVYNALIINKITNWFIANIVTTSEIGKISADY